LKYGLNFKRFNSIIFDLIRNVYAKTLVSMRLF